MAWLRLSIIGAAATELSAANIGAEACGVTLGTEQYTLICLAVSWFTMAYNHGDTQGIFHQFRVFPAHGFNEEHH